MRARAILFASILSVGLGAAASDCQVFAGLTVLEINTGTGTGGGGGEGGGTSTSTSTSTSTTTGTGGTGGAGGGPECTEASSCGDDTTCETFACKAGACSSDQAPKGKPCTEGGGQLCDGMGKCVPPSCMDGFKNGGELDVDCGGPCGKCGDGKLCNSVGDCQNGLYCAKADGEAQGMCRPIKALGDGCLGAAECGPNFCTDGVCCQTASCIDGCWSCALSGTGKCTVHEGKACGDPTDDECTDPDTCNAMGNCQANHAAAGFACGDSSDTACTAPDTCDGAGKCKSNHAPMNTACGSAVVDTCTAADSCDGVGNCLSHDVGNGTLCGNSCVGDTLYAPGTCTAGVCSAQGVPCPGNYACNGAQTACNTQCNSSAECASGTLCLAMLHNCVACGIFPPPPYTCTPGSGTCDAQNECNTNKTLGGMGMGIPPARLECNGQCNGITVTCQGPSGCEVICGPGGCNNLHLNCDLNGPCKLTCHGNSCAGASVGCGDNTCDVSCDQLTAMTHTCNGACSCLDTGCK
jgi:hypothetical protein